MFLIAKIPTPIFNTPDIPFNYLPLKKDDQGRLMEIETIAFPGTKFTCLSKISENIFQVETAEYPSSASLYVDSRFLQAASCETPEREKILPSVDDILNWIESRIGLRYFWGGNWASGIPEILEFYPFLKNPSSEDSDDIICRGLDCSGILYQATNGYTPRNTSDLIHFGKEVSLEQIKPLDLLVWKGHVMIVQFPTTLIESRIGRGVVVSPFEQRYLEVLDLLKIQNKKLYIRRWHPDSLHPN
jgi:cell wall-associated NlpC family hydrolase